MKRSFLFSLFILSTFALVAQSYKSAETTAYIAKYHKIAIREMYVNKIPASITLAQGILESASGRSDLATKANNHFGIKCTSDYSGKKFFKDDDKKNDCFRVYNHAEDSYRDHSQFLKKSRYSDLFSLKITDYKGWAKGLKNDGYATNPKYPELLINVIEQNELYLYDRNPEKYLSRKEAEEYNLLEDEKPLHGITNTDLVIAPSPVKGNRINGVKCIEVKSGDTFYSLSRKLGVSVEQLQSFNDFPTVLKAGEYIFTEPKKKKNKSASPHQVKSGESWYSISQHYGVQQARLKKMNKGKSLRPGVYVRLH